MAINKELQHKILSRLEDWRLITDLVEVDGFQKELQTLEDEGKVESTKPSPGESYYANYKITSYGRTFL